MLTSIILCSVGIGNVWGAETLKTTCVGTGSGYGTRRTATYDDIGWVLASGQSGYLGANSAANHNKVMPTAADLPVVKAQNASATTSTTGYYFYYTSTAIANVTKIEFSYTAKTGSSTVNAYVVSSSTAAASGSATWSKPTLASGTGLSAQGANIASATGTYTFKLNAKETSSKYYGIILQTSSYSRLTAGSIKIYVDNAVAYTVNWTINPAAGGSLSATSGTSTTVTPNSAYTYGSPAYTVTTGSATVSQSTNTFTATPSANCTIRINMVEKPKYTVTLMDDGDTRTQASAGAAVTLPSREGCAGYTFAGWTKTWVAPQSSWTTTAPTIIPAGSYTPSANENLYPVYTKTEGGGTAFDSYEKVTSAPDDWTAHKYVIATADNGVVLTGYAANYYGGYTTMSTSTEMASYEITVTEVSAGIYKLYQNSKYLALNANENRLYFLDSYTGSDGTNNKCDWKFYNYSGGYIVESPLTYTISKTSGCYRAIQYNNTSGQERFACYKHNTQTIAYLYMRKETSGSTTYYISVPNCCDKNVTLAHNSPSNGTVTFSPAGPIATCSATEADRQTTMTIAPNAGYKLTSWSTTGVTPASVSPAVATSGDDSKSAQAITVTFTQNTTTGTYTANATFTAMVDHYIDKLHADINTSYDGVGRAFNTAGYSVPSLSNGGDPADDSCAEAHYKFVGWIDEAYVDTDGTLTDASKMFTATGTKNPSDTNFIAVWAKEK